MKYLINILTCITVNIKSQTFQHYKRHSQLHTSNLIVKPYLPQTSVLHALHDFSLIKQLSSGLLSNQILFGTESECL